MEQFIEKLRKKPVHVRRTILMVTTTAITAFIFVIWFYFWTSAAVSPDDINNVATPRGAPPSSLLKDNWQAFQGTFSEGFSEIKKQINF